jgi:membrane-associated protein
MAIDKVILGGGYLAIGLTVFAESGLLIGFFLPGDTLLFGAGILASQGVFQFPLLVLVVIAGAIIGDNVGYSIGRRFGPRLFKRQDGAIFRQDYLQRAEAFYEKHGGKTVIIARFVPIVRTFAPVVAGISKMPRQQFIAYNIVGGILWGATLPAIGYFLGSRIPWIENYIEPVILTVVALSIIPPLFHLLQQETFRTAVKAKLARALKAISGRT